LVSSLALFAKTLRSDRALLAIKDLRCGPMNAHTASLTAPERQPAASISTKERYTRRYPVSQLGVRPEEQTSMDWQPIRDWFPASADGIFAQLCDVLNPEAELGSLFPDMHPNHGVFSPLLVDTDEMVLPAKFSGFASWITLSATRPNTASTRDVRTSRIRRPASDQQFPIRAVLRSYDFSPVIGQPHGPPRPSPMISAPGRVCNITPLSDTRRMDVVSTALPLISYGAT
jgi:hypothetical protein